MGSSSKTTTLLKQLRQELPRLLRQDTQVRGEIIGILSDYLTTREETAAILTELRQLDRRMGSLERTLGAIGARWGIMLSRKA